MTFVVAARTTGELMLKKRASASAVASALVILSLAGCAPAGSSPEDVLDDYLTAISEGRAADALKLIEHAGQDDAALLTDDVLSAAEERISDVQVGKDAAPEGTDYEVSDNGGNIPYAYSLAGETFYGTAPLFRSDDGSWKVDGLPGDGSILGTITLSASPTGLLDEATFGGVEVPIGESQLVFPAVYSPDLLPADGFESEAVQPVRITGDDGRTVNAEIVPTTATTAKAESLAADALGDDATCSYGAPEDVLGSDFYYREWSEPQLVLIEKAQEIAFYCDGSERTHVVVAVPNLEVVR